MKILMLGVYDINFYSRGRIFYKGLKSNSINTSIYLPKGKLKYLKLIKRILKRDFDKIIVTGKFVLITSWLTKPIHRKKIIFDVFISDYENLVLDRKKVKKNTIKAKLLKMGDKVSCLLSNHNILDTNEHIAYFCKEFKLKKSKFSKVYVGADDEIFKPSKIPSNKEIEFHGTFIPLQGIEHIIRAAKELEKEKIKFKIIGEGDESKKIQKEAEKLNIKNIEFINKNVSLTELAKEIQKSEICLGVFGDSQKAKNVIPNKAYEIIASKKPLITSDTPGIREVFEDKKNCLLCKPYDHIDLAKKITKLKNNKKLKDKISNNGYKLFKERFSIQKTGEALLKVINS